MGRHHNTRSSKRRRIESEETEAASSEAASSEAASSEAASSEAASSRRSNLTLSMPPYTNVYPMEERKSRYREGLKKYTGFSGELVDGFPTMSGKPLPERRWIENKLFKMWAYIQDKVIIYMKDWVERKLEISKESDNPETRDVNDLNNFFIKETYELLKKKMEDESFLYDRLRIKNLRSGEGLSYWVKYIAKKSALPKIDMVNLKAGFPPGSTEKKTEFVWFLYAFEFMTFQQSWEHDFEVPGDIIPGSDGIRWLQPIDIVEKEGSPLNGKTFPIKIEREEAEPGKIITRTFKIPFDGKRAQMALNKSLIRKSNIPYTTEHREALKEIYETFNKRYNLDNINVFEKEFIFLTMKDKNKNEYNKYLILTMVIHFLKVVLAECEEERKRKEEERKRKEYLDEMIEKTRLEHERKTSTFRASKKSEKKKKPKKSEKKKKKKKKPISKSKSRSKSKK